MPVVRHFRDAADMDVAVCVTAQHRHMLDQVLNVFQVQPEYDLNAMRPGHTLAESASRILASIEPVIRDSRPDMVLVQGDTTTTLCGALAAFYAGVPVGHVEAGLRTGDMLAPFPEEMNRVVAGRLATLHFAATDWAAQNLVSEGVSQDVITVTGNTGIDAVLYTRDRLDEGSVSGPAWDFLGENRRIVLVTAHRRESFGPGFERICKALQLVANMHGVQLVYPVHPNPSVSGIVRRELGSHPNIHLIEPLDYVAFVDLMRRAWLLLTDSGGVQEEGPSLGKPVLVLREKTERPEAVKAGTAVLVGTDVDKIVSSVDLLLRNNSEYERRSRVHNPYGDGHASERIARFMTAFFSSREPACNHR